MLAKIAHDVTFVYGVSIRRLLQFYLSQKRLSAVAGSLISFLIYILFTLNRLRLCIYLIFFNFRNLSILCEKNMLQTWPNVPVKFILGFLNHAIFTIGFQLYRVFSMVLIYNDCSLPSVNAKLCSQVTVVKDEISLIYPINSWIIFNKYC